MKKVRLLLSVILSFIFITCVGASVNAVWYEDNYGKYYIDGEDDALYIGLNWIDHSLYLFDDDGYLETGTWYIDDDGEEYYFGSDGKAIRGKSVKIGGTAYHFDYNGKRVTTPVESEGWHKTSNGKYYYISKGKKVVGLMEIGEDSYYFDDNGLMKTGWLKIDSNYYYFKSDGKMVVGADRVIDGKRYYFDDVGMMYTPKTSTNQSHTSTYSPPSTSTYSYSSPTTTYNYSNPSTTRSYSTYDDSYTSTSSSSKDRDYVLNTNTHKFHYPWCSSVSDIYKKNRYDYYGNRDDIINSGYVPCKKCCP